VASLVDVPVIRPLSDLPCASIGFALQVRLCQKTDTGKIYAMKTLMKNEMFKKDQVRPWLRLGV